MPYDVPSADDLQQRYPAFAEVDDGTITYWIEDARRFVSTRWVESDYAPGLMALAAHNMALAGLGADAEAAASLPAGVTRMKSGSLELGFTDRAANARFDSVYGSTRYGQEYRMLLRRNMAGARVTATGAEPYDSLHYPHGEA
jgi:hypothetical protein